VDLFSNELKAIFLGPLDKNNIANIKSEREAAKPIVMLVTPVSGALDVV
jgi:hypothetical protein